VTLVVVYCGQTVGQIKVKLGTQVGLGLGHIVLDEDRAPHSPKEGGAPSNFWPISVEAKWLQGSRFKIPLGTEVGLGPGDFVLDGDPAPPFQKGNRAPNFRPMFIVAKRLDGSRS